MPAHVVTLGGGGFSMADDDTATALDRYIVGLAGARRPRVMFVPTASADSENYIGRFRTAFKPLGVDTDVLTLWSDARASVGRLTEADVVYVGGGSTFNLLALWRAHGVDRILQERSRESGVVLAGISAGANCWYEACLTDSFGDLAPLLDGLALVPGSFCPHYDGEAERAPALQKHVDDRSLPPGWAADDGAAIHWHDGEIIAHLSERPDAATYRIEASGSHRLRPTFVS